MAATRSTNVTDCPRAEQLALLVGEPLTEFRRTLDPE